MSAARTLALLMSVSLCTAFGMPGGLRDARTCDESCEEVVADIKAAIEKFVGTTYTKFEPLEYKTQVVAGTNYFIKIAVGDTCVYVRAFKPLPQAPPAESLSNIAYVQGPAVLKGLKTGGCSDEITYF